MPNWPLLVPSLLVAWIGLSLTVGVLLGGMLCATGEPGRRRRREPAGRRGIR